MLRILVQLKQNDNFYRFWKYQWKKEKSLIFLDSKLPIKELCILITGLNILAFIGRPNLKNYLKELIILKLLLYLNLT